jgi:hypothetical protein
MTKKSHVIAISLQTQTASAAPRALADPRTADERFDAWDILRTGKPVDTGTRRF